MSARSRSIRNHAGQRRWRQHCRHDHRRDAGAGVRCAGPGCPDYGPARRLLPQQRQRLGRQHRGYCRHRKHQPDLYRFDARADNYKAGGNFKTTTATGRIGHTLPLDEVGSTAYESLNQMLSFALKGGNHLVEAKFGFQHIPEQLYPNQRMDMLDNEQKTFNLRYLGQVRLGAVRGAGLLREGRPAFHGLRTRQAVLVRPWRATGRFRR
jgi:hypothetical protein